MVLGGGAFGRFFGHEGGAFMKEISALGKEVTQSFLALATTWGHNEREWARKRGEGHLPEPKHVGTSILDFEPL